ncbi:class I SAM-dependent methyltransferase [Streptomyces sp. NPDC006649]|uniref:SAM-dependent methyltransferase n=1 Tax=Streptomyces sp. NPDC006649 TaxID=3156896 RepID=UPI00339FE486
MDSYPIADRYSVVPAEAPLDASGYADALHSDFRHHYADGRDVWTGEAAMREAPRQLLDALGRAAGLHVLDLGSGRGRDAEILLDGGQRVTGVDLVASPEWADITERGDGRARFLATAVTDLPGTAEYDAALDNGCLHHQHPDAYGPYLRRVRELLRPHALFVVSVFQAPGETGGLYTNAGKRLYREFTAGELTALLGAEGFEPVELNQVPRGIKDLTYLVGTFRRVTDGAA